VRLIYKLRCEQLDLIDRASIHEALKVAHNYTIRPELTSQLARPRLPELGIGKSLDPIEALSSYLKNREDLKDISADMLEAAQRLLGSGI
jgi:DNA repair protein SbcD/Mre11